MTRHAVVCLMLFTSNFLFASPQASGGNADLAIGIQAYKNAKYEEAAQHLERAAANEPGNVQAHLYLANVYAQQYIPGRDEESNPQQGNAAIREYRRVLELDAKNMEAVKGLGQMYFQMKELDQAAEVYRGALGMDAKDAELYYSIAVIDWTRTYQPRMEQRAKLKLRQEQPLIFAAECSTVREANWERVADGMEMLKKAIDLRHDYDDAMAYMNLMYRERADVQCNDPRARAADLKAADDWVDMTLAIKNRKAASQQRSKTKSGSTSSLSGETENSTAPNPR
jgi:tetratricopeptide (TPR) repeat protein